MCLQVIRKIGVRLKELAAQDPRWEKGIDPPPQIERVCVKEIFSETPFYEPKCEDSGFCKVKWLLNDFIREQPYSDFPSTAKGK